LSSTTAGILFSLFANRRKTISFAKLFLTEEKAFLLKLQAWETRWGNGFAQIFIGSGLGFYYINQNPEPARAWFLV
jgi:hypothetical protein